LRKASGRFPKLNNMAPCKPLSFTAGEDPLTKYAPPHHPCQTF
jgi:hypothetical protein